MVAPAKSPTKERHHGCAVSPKCQVASRLQNPAGISERSNWLSSRSHACGGYGRGKETGDDIKIIFLPVARYLKEEGLHPVSLRDLIDDKWLFLRLHTSTFSCVHPAREFTLSDTRFNSMILECGLWAILVESDPVAPLEDSFRKAAPSAHVSIVWLASAAALLLDGRCYVACYNCSMAFAPYTYPWLLCIGPVSTAHYVQ